MKIEEIKLNGKRAWKVECAHRCETFPKLRLAWVAMKARTCCGKKELQIWPYVPTNKEWEELPWNAAKIAAEKKWNSSHELQFIGWYADSKIVFVFQLFGKGNVEVTK